MRVEWSDLPEPVREAVTARTGPVASVDSVAAGTMSPVAVHLRTATGDDLFVKGIRSDDERAVWMCRNEQRLGLVLPGIAPSARWLFEADGWVLLGVEWVHGRSADLTPGSGDLPLVADALRRVAELATPCPGRWPPLGKRWSLPGPAFDGETLVHADLCADNILVSGRQALIIDWAWPARGPAWADAAMLVARLIRAGHTPAEAEAWAAAVPAWHEAGAEDITAFAAGRASVITKSKDPRPEIVALAEATCAWRDFRTG